MKSIGLIIASISALCLLLALNMSTTVTTEEKTFGDFTVPSMTVNNLGLMQDKQNYIIVSAVFLILGVGIYLLARKNDSQKFIENDESDHKPNKEKIGQEVKNLQINSLERNIDNDAYKIYLLKKYPIEHNTIINKYILMDRLFDTADDALTYASEFDIKSTVVNPVGLPTQVSSQESVNKLSSSAATAIKKVDAKISKIGTNILIIVITLVIIVLILGAAGTLRK